MSSTKSKLGQNPLAGRGVAALFSTEAEAPTPASKAVEAQGAPAKPPQRTHQHRTTTVSHLVNKVTQPSTDETDFERHTYYLTEAQGQKVKLYALIHRMQISEVIRMLIDNHLKIQP